MAPRTPDTDAHDRLAPLVSRIVDVDRLPWRDTPYPGVSIKVLLEDEASGLMTALFHWEPGAVLPLHEHTAIEQTYVLDGAFEDADGEVKAGDFVWRPTGSRHEARSPGGALMLGIFQKPNAFL